MLNRIRFYVLFLALFGRFAWGLLLLCRRGGGRVARSGNFAEQVDEQLPIMAGHAIQ